MQSRIAYSADDAALLQSRPSGMTNKIGPQTACRRHKKSKAGPQPQHTASEKAPLLAKNARNGAPGPVPAKNAGTRAGQPLELRFYSERMGQPPDELELQCACEPSPVHPRLKRPYEF